MASLMRRVSQSFGSLRSSRSSRASIISTSSTSTTTTNTTTSSNGKTEITLLGSAELNQVAYGEKKDMLIMASIKAPMYEKKEEDKRAPIDICCVIDKSGSMAGEKLKLVKEAMKFVIDNLDSKDKLSVVLYDTEVSTLFDFELMSSSQKSKAKQLVDGINDGSSTNLYGGLERGLQLSSKRKSPNEICSVLLFTDGLANEGRFTSSSDICNETKKMVQKMTKKCTVFTFGFGSDHDENMLRSIAECGNGMYYFVSKPDSIPTSFADCLGGLQSIVAQNLSLSVKTSSKDIQIIKSLNPKYQVKGSLPSNTATVELTDIYSEESRDIIFLVQIPELKEAVDHYQLVQFELTYFNTLTVQDESCSASLEISRPQTPDDKIEVNLELDKQRNRLKAAEAMELSRKLAEEGKFTEAQNLLATSKKEINTSVSNNDDYCLKLASEMDECFSDVANVQVYQEKGSKNISRKAQAHYYQRSNKIEDTDISFYENTSKVSSKAKSKAFF